MADAMQGTFKKWNVMKHVGEDQLNNIIYFNGFQVAAEDDGERKSGALFLTADDEMFAVGFNNADNVLALTDENFAKQVELKEPKKIEKLSGLKIVKFAVTERFGAAITSEGKLIYWGMEMKALQYEERSQKYVKSPHEPLENFRAVDMACGAHSITFITVSGQIVIWGCINLYYSEFYNFKQIRTSKNVQIKAISCGWYHVALLDQNGYVWTFGYGSVGQLGYNWSAAESGYTVARKAPLPNVCTKVECGAYSTLFLLQNGQIYACGSNSNSDHLCVVRSGYVVTPEKVLLEDRITDVAAAYAWSGRWQSLFGAYSQESNKYYKWGNDSTVKSPILSSDTHTFLDMFANFKTPQSVANVSWSNSIDLSVSTALAQNIPSSKRRSFFDRWEAFDKVTDELLAKIESFTVITIVPYRFFSGEAYHCYVVTVDDDVYGWSTDKRIDLLGQPKETALTLAPAKMEILSKKKIKKILVNYNEGLALSKDGIVYSWGNSSPPEQLKILGDVRVRDIVSEISQSYFLTENNTIYKQRRGDDILQISLPVNDRIVALECGEHHCAVLTEESEVFTFGTGRWGQLGYKVEEEGESSEDELVINLSDAIVLPEDARKVALPGPCKKVACGVDASYFLLTNGELYASGINSAADVLAVGHRGSVYTPEKVLVKDPIADVVANRRHNNISARVSTVAVLTTKGEIYKWGGNLSTPTLVEGVTTLAEAFENTDIPQSLSLLRYAPNASPEPDEEYDSDEDQPTNKEATLADSSLFGDPLYSDLNIKLANSTIAAHRFILHTKSSFFKNELESNRLNNRNELDLTSYNPKSIIALLKHIYGLPIGEDASLLKDLIDFHGVAKADGHNELLTKSEKLLTKNLMRMAFKRLKNSGSPKDLEKILGRFIRETPFP